MPRYLHHLTLQTRDLSRSYRSEVDDESVAAATESLLRARDERTPLEPMLRRGYVMTASWEGHSAMLATIWWHEAPVVTFGVATNSRSAAGLWRIMLRDYNGPPIDGLEPPSPPWVVSRMEMGAVLVMQEGRRDELITIGAMGAPLGWAFLEGIR